MSVVRGLSLSRGYAVRVEERQMGKGARKSHGLGAAWSSGPGGWVRAEQSWSKVPLLSSSVPPSPSLHPTSILPQRWLNE